MSFEIFVASVPDRKKVVVAIWYNNAQLAELSNERESLDLELYANPSGEPWKIGFDEFVLVLAKAKGRLLNQDFGSG
jgi:hypothetical protein